MLQHSNDDDPRNLPEYWPLEGIKNDNLHSGTDPVRVDAVENGATALCALLSTLCTLDRARKSYIKTNN